MPSERDLSHFFCAFLKSLNLFLWGFLFSVLWSGKNNTALNVRCSHQRYNILPSQKDPSPVKSIAMMRERHIHGLKILGISFLIDVYHFIPLLYSSELEFSTMRLGALWRKQAWLSKRTGQQVSFLQRQSFLQALSITNLPASCKITSERQTLHF